ERRSLPRHPRPHPRPQWIASVSLLSKARLRGDRRDARRERSGEARLLHVEAAMKDDPRFHAAIALLNAGDYAEAADAFEELFFESVRGEVELVRALMQVATGMLHIERGQARAAIERLEEGIGAGDRVPRGHGIERDA